MPPQILELTEAVLRRPEMYTLLGSPAEVFAFLDGFVSGRAGAGGPIAAWSEFTAWLGYELDVPESEVLGSILKAHGASATAELLRRVVEYRALTHSADAEPRPTTSASREGPPSTRELQFAANPGASWRVLARGEQDETIEPAVSGTFDELVVDHWLHIEQMDDRTWWLRVGDARLMAAIGSDGRTSVDVIRGFYDDINGTTNDWMPPA